MHFLHSLNIRPRVIHALFAQLRKKEKAFGAAREGEQNTFPLIFSGLHDHSAQPHDAWHIPCLISAHI